MYHRRDHESVIAAGHPETADAAVRVLEAGGNAFDAAVAACCAACVAEPVLASLGGGGFLLARPAGGDPVLYDFFVQTPGRRCDPGDAVLYPVTVDFGDACQEFHIGMGAIATPGVIAGLCAVQRELCRLPLPDLIAPAVRLAREGVTITAYQYGLARIVEPILRAAPAAFATQASRAHPGELARPGEVLVQPELAEALEALASEGARVLYDGPWGERLVADCAAAGGHLREPDLAGYRVARRNPLPGRYRDAAIFTNPPPSLGGGLILFALRLLAEVGLGSAERGGRAHLDALARAMALTQRLRREGGAGEGADPLAAELLSIMRDGLVVSRGTTQISVADVAGNLASLTLSNGEGSGYVLPGTGIVLNNMLGEEDLNPLGFHAWPEKRRMGSMMAPTLVERGNGAWVVTGSSGSNRIRSAILQVLVNLIDFGLPVAEAVAAPRVHYEGGLLNLEPPVPARVLAELEARWPNQRLWSAPSVFFGGSHSVTLGPDGRLDGGADPRRGGVVRWV